MSYVTDVVVHVEYAPLEAENQLTEAFPFEELRKGVGLRRISHHDAGGSKVFQGDIYAGAFNYLDVEALVEWFVNLLWEDTGSAVMSTSSEGESYRVVVIRDGEANFPDRRTLREDRSSTHTD